MAQIDTTFDLNLIRLLVALDEARSVSRAAEQLGMSQSGFSTALARLRQRFGDPIFVRTGNGMEPTARAVTMIEAARDALASVQSRILVQPDFDPSTTRAVFKLAMADVAEIVFLPKLLQHLERVAPSVQVISEPWARDALRPAMQEGRVDLALGYFPDLEGAGFYLQRLYLHTYACMLRPRHPLLGQEMTLQGYGAVGHAVVSAPARSDDLFEEFLQRRKIVRRVGLRTPHHLSLPAIIESTDLIATVPIATADRYARLGLVRLARLPFSPPVFSVQQNWHARTHQEPRMRWFRAQIASLFNDETDPWKAVEQELYGQLRKRTSSGRKSARQPQ